NLPRILILAQSGVSIKNLFFGPLLPALRNRAEVRVMTDHYGESPLGALAAESGVTLVPFVYTDFDAGGLTGRLESFLVGCWDIRGVSKTRLSKRRLLPERPRNFLHVGWLRGLHWAQRLVASQGVLETLDEAVEARLLQAHPSPSMLEHL